METKKKIVLIILSRLVLIILSRLSEKTGVILLKEVFQLCLPSVHFMAALLYLSAFPLVLGD